MAEEPLLDGEDDEDNENDLTVCYDRDLAKWGEQSMPRWIQATAVRTIIQEEAKEGRYEPIDLNRTAGPAVQWGLSTLVGLVYFLSCLPVVGTWIARCPDVERSKKYAAYPEALLWIIFFVPLVCLVFLAQWKMCTYTLVPMLQQIRKHKVNEKQRATFPFNLWFLIYSVLTVFNLLDQMTNALFTAKTWATRHCYGYQFIEHKWQETIHHSPALRLLFIDRMGLDFAEFTAVAYFVQLFIQPFVAASYSLPVFWNERRDENEEYGKGLPVNYNVVMERTYPISEYKTLSDDQFNPDDLTTHASAAVVLAEVNRMEAVVALDMDYRRALCKQLRINLVEKIQTSGGDQEAILAAKQQTLDECLEIAIAATARGIARFSLKGLVQNAVQVNLQVTLAAISKTVLKGGLDLFNAFSIGTTIVSMFFDIPDVILTLTFATKILKQVEKMYSNEGPDSEQLREHLSRKVSSLRWRIIRLKIYGVLYMCLAALALMKLIFAVGICKQGTWNLSSINHDWGCVDKDTHLNVTTCPVAEYICK